MPKKSVPAVRAALRAAGVTGVVGKIAGSTVVMVEVDHVEPVFKALTDAGYTFQRDGDGDYVQSATIS